MMKEMFRITSYNVCYTKLLRGTLKKEGYRSKKPSLYCRPIVVNSTAPIGTKYNFLEMFNFKMSGNRSTKIITGIRSIKRGSAAKP